MRHKSSPQSGRMNVNRRQVCLPSKKTDQSQWRRKVGDFKSVNEKFTKENERKVEVFKEEKKKPLKRRLIDPNISHNIFSILGSHFTNMWNIYNWGQSEDSILYSLISPFRPHFHCDPITELSSSFNHSTLNHYFHRMSSELRVFKTDFVNVDDILEKV